MVLLLVDLRVPVFCCELELSFAANLNCGAGLQHESGKGKSSKTKRADITKDKAVPPPGTGVRLSTSDAFRAILPILPILPSLPMLSGPVFEQQNEHQLQAQAAGGGTRLGGKRSHLKRQLKVPTKLQSKGKEPDDGCGHKTYKKGLFEKRFKQLVWLPSRASDPTIHFLGRHPRTLIPIDCLLVYTDWVQGEIRASERVDGQNQLLLCSRARRMGECTGM